MNFHFLSMFIRGRTKKICSTKDLKKKINHSPKGHAANCGCDKWWWLTYRRATCYELGHRAWKDNEWAAEIPNMPSKKDKLSRCSLIKTRGSDVIPNARKFTSF